MDQVAAGGRLRTAVVLLTAEDSCTVFTADQRTDVPHARAFPKPRIERVLPGHLVAIATAPAGSAFVVWRWFDAVVLDRIGSSVRVWEPAHGVVRAELRDPRRNYRPETRAYLTAGLPGAEWWVAGPVADRAEDAEVDLDQVDKFFTGLDLWAGLG